MKALFLILSLSTCSLLATEYYQFRQWTSSSGEKVTAKYLSSDNNSVTLIDSQNSSKTIPISKLSNEDRIYIRSITRNQEIKFRQPEVTNAMRLLIPSLQYDLFGSTNTNGAAVAAANFFLWWDQQGVLPLPYSEKKLDELADSLHRDLKNTLPTNDQKPQELKNGLAQFIERKALQKKYTPSFEFQKATEDNLKDASRKGEMCLLSLSTLKNGRIDKGRYVSVIALNQQIIQFNTWGQNFIGVVRPGTLNSEKGVFIDIVRDPGTPAYDWITKQGGGFFINEKTDFIATMQFVRKTSR